MIADTWAWRDQPTDQVGPILTSRLQELRTEVMRCQSGEGIGHYPTECSPMLRGEASTDARDWEWRRLVDKQSG